MESQKKMGWDNRRKTRLKKLDRKKVETKTNFD